jgi:protein TonB
MKDRTILASALIAGIIHALILFANLGMTPPTLASAAASIEVDLVAAPAAPAPAPAPEPPMPPIPAAESDPEPVVEPIPEPEIIPEPEPEPEPEPGPLTKPIIEPEPEPEPEPVVEIPHETAVVEPPAEIVSTPGVNADVMRHEPEEQMQTYIDDAGEAGALTEQPVPTFDPGPAYTYNPKPRYPRTARRRGQQGTVVLLVEVRANGRAGEIEIEKSSGYELLDNAAVKAIRRWRFVPAEKAGIPVGTKVKIPVEFNLEGEK